jgi:hypothetical protein
VRFHGALAPRSSWRREVVPKPREPETKKPQTLLQSSATAIATTRRQGNSRRADDTRCDDAITRAQRARRSPLGTPEFRHLVATTRIDWASLMRRTFDVDVLACPKCTSKLRIVAV